MANLLLKSSPLSTFLSPPLRGSNFPLVFLYNPRKTQTLTLAREKKTEPVMKNEDEPVMKNEDEEKDGQLKMAHDIVEEAITQARVIVATIKQMISSNIKKGSQFESRKTWNGLSYYAMNKLLEGEYEVSKEKSEESIDEYTVFTYQTSSGIGCKLVLHRKGLMLFLTEPLWSVYYYGILSKEEEEKGSSEKYKKKGSSEEEKKKKI